ncbi:GuaB1 family IMP dehydrogenase-related protein, partial [Leucobacter sp. M11]|uniref:GuaB1 family IMP dehydrogenase-related protein n=1 Tax=Leucobacter sp. M11 TaxID=2993565 RepID=UPI002D7E2C4A
LPQDLSAQELDTGIRWVKAQPVRFDSPVTLPDTASVAHALALVTPTPGQAIIVMNAAEEIVGIVPAVALPGVPADTPIAQIAAREWLSLNAEQLDTPRAAFDALAAADVDFAPVLDHGRLVGSLNRDSALRAVLYAPHTDADGRLAIAAAIGINGDPVQRATALAEAGVDVLVLDTAHGHQNSMLAAIEAVADQGLGVPIVAGNVVTGQAVRDLVSAGADIVKVGVGPGAMCTTRMMTGVGRPQLSAVLDTAAVAAKAGVGVWADGGISHPRDVALALAAGATSVMIGSWFTGTLESPGELRFGPDGSAYKTNFGMASEAAVRARFARLDPFERAKKLLFSEGISESRIAVDPQHPSVEDVIDRIVAGVRSACTYAGARTLTEFRDRAVYGVQSASGYAEGQAKAIIGSVTG